MTPSLPRLPVTSTASLKGPFGAPQRAAALKGRGEEDCSAPQPCQHPKALPSSGSKALRTKQGQELTDGGTQPWGHCGDVAKARQNPWQGQGQGEISRALISCNFFLSLSQQDERGGTPRIAGEVVPLLIYELLPFGRGADIFQPDVSKPGNLGTDLQALPAAWTPKPAPEIFCRDREPENLQTLSWVPHTARDFRGWGEPGALPIPASSFWGSWTSPPTFSWGGKDAPHHRNAEISVCAC